MVQGPLISDQIWLLLFQIRDGEGVHAFGGSVQRAFGSNSGSLIHLRGLPNFSKERSADTRVALEDKLNAAAKLSADPSLYWCFRCDDASGDKHTSLRNKECFGLAREVAMLRDKMKSAELP
jgi:hypothetical protein